MKEPIYPLNKRCTPETVWMMWLVVLFIFHWSVHYGMCSTASCSAE